MQRNATNSNGNTQKIENRPKSVTGYVLGLKLKLNEALERKLKHQNIKTNSNQITFDLEHLKLIIKWFANLVIHGPNILTNT